ncbi:hypothetical protein [Dickeya lacustris]|uniref:Uncharacterized protein n=1 Tax=Dickeya lacustris TaxID=2259638 RepID=A0ABY8G7W4_9GAMM|nr:hypothetical protein [Dickeya lacustris]WFN56005.1 hypothetical protein O1Q98_01365 [Dickeya lacustris]
MAALDAFLPAVRKHITGPLDIMMRQSIREAAIAFCRESLICRDTVLLTNVQPGIAYPLTESPLVKCVKRLLITNLSNPDTPSELDAGTDFTVISANHLVFNHAYSRVSALFAVEPRRDADAVPDALADDYTDVVAAGALEDLYIMPGQPWSDPQRAAYFRAIFTDGYRRAYRDALDNSPVTGFQNPVRRHEFY